VRSLRLPLFYDFLVKFAGVLLVVAVGIATIGVPLDMPFAKQITEYFPCMSCGCGCADAEVCWRQCCCFNTDQKIAWAREHGVAVPEFLLAEAKVEAAATCANQVGDDFADLKPCCRKRVLDARKKAKEQAVTTGVMAIQMLKCQGLSFSLTSLPPSITPPAVEAALILLPPDSILWITSNFYEPPIFATVVPPPEFAAI
jgi:hypothetical protein